jgi:hypothetical protein
MKLVFWVSFGVFFYTVLGYPAFMTLLGKLFHRPLRRGGEAARRRGTVGLSHHRGL